MSIKLVDSLSPMGSFPVAEAKDIVFDDKESLQDKLDNGGLGSGGGSSITVDSELSEESENPIQNKVVKVALDKKQSTTGDSKDNTISFSTAMSRTNIATGEKHSTIFGKIAKYFTDMKAFCFNSLVTSLATKPTAGSAIDAATVYDALQNVTPNTSIVSDAYSSTKTYAVGDYCIYNNSLYKCKVACTGKVPTDATYWTKVSVMGDIKSKRVDYERIISPQTLTQDATVSTYLDRRIENYNTLVFCFGDVQTTHKFSRIRGTQVVPTAWFRTDKAQVMLVVVHGGGGGDAATGGYKICSATFEYVSDTSIKVHIGDSKVINGIAVYGVALTN